MSKTKPGSEAGISSRLFHKGPVTNSFRFYGPQSLSQLAIVAVEGKNSHKQYITLLRGFPVDF